MIIRHAPRSRRLAMIRVGLVDIETSHRERVSEIIQASDDARITAVCLGGVCPEAEAALSLSRAPYPILETNPTEGRVGVVSAG